MASVEIGEDDRRRWLKVRLSLLKPLKLAHAGLIIIRESITTVSLFIKSTKLSKEKSLKVEISADPGVDTPAPKVNLITSNVCKS